MSWYGDYGGWPPRVPVATKIARGHAAAKKLAKKEGREPCPITIDGRKIAKTFWGLKWCENLDRYRDIESLAARRDLRPQRVRRRPYDRARQGAGGRRRH